jgi:hypothetical protein
MNAAPHGDHFSRSLCVCHGPVSSSRQEAKSKNAQYNELLGAPRDPIAMLNGFLCVAWNVTPAKTVQADWISAEICIQFALADAKSTPHKEKWRRFASAKQF